MQHFQPILIVIGILAIVGVLIHGFLLNRKSKISETQSASQDEQTNSADSMSIDEQNEDDEPPLQLSSINDDNDNNEQPLNFQLNDDDPDNIDINKFQFEEDDASQTAETKETELASQSLQQLSSEAAEPNSEPAASDEAQLTSSESDTKEDAVTSETEIPATGRTNAPEVKSLNTDEPQDIFIFNVVSKEDGHLGGHELLQFFLTSGFRFGEMHIFHRHEHSDGTGEVLFSIANMLAPGTFELDEMEQFNSPGVSFFLTAPNDKISVKKSFDMMLRAVEQMAEEFDCDVLNAQREPLTEAQFIDYRNRLQQYL